MTFQEWWNRNGNAFAPFVSKHDVALAAWKRATEEERERCIEIVERQTTISLVNQIRTGEDKGAQP